MPFLWILLLLGLSFTANAQNKVDEQGRKQGPWVKMYPNTQQPRYKGQFSNDQPVGEFTYFEPTGQKSATVVHLGEGKAKTTTYYTDGKVNSVGNYINQLKDSIWEYYDEEGRLLSKESYVQSKRNGKNTVFYPSGSISLEQEFKMDKLHGAVVTYYPNGKKKSENFFQEDVNEGPTRTYFESGSISLEGTYAKGMPTGVWKEFNADGTVRQTTDYTQPRGPLVKRINGEFTEYFENELPKAVYNYREGELDGPFSEYHEGGRWELVERIDPRTEEKDTYRKPVNHHLKRKGTHKGGKWHGTIEEFNPDGTPAGVFTYVMGQKNK